MLEELEGYQGGRKTFPEVFTHLKINKKLPVFWIQVLGAALISCEALDVYFSHAPHQGLIEEAANLHDEREG